MFRIRPATFVKPRVTTACAVRWRSASGPKRTRSTSTPTWCRWPLNDPCLTAMDKEQGGPCGRPFSSAKRVKVGVDETPFALHRTLPGALLHGPDGRHRVTSPTAHVALHVMHVPPRAAEPPRHWPRG